MSYISFKICQLIMIGGVSSLLLNTGSAAAQKLVLMDLPVGCTYTENSSQPLTGSIKIPAATPLFSEIGGAPHTLLSVGVQCSGVIDQDVTIGVKENGSVNWLGAARDVLATDVKGIGVRLIAEGVDDKGLCRGMGTVSASSMGECRIQRDGETNRSINFSLKAQLIKISENTPIQSHKTLRIAGSGSVLLSGSATTQATTDILNSGLLSPAIFTEASCTLITPKNHSVNFGTVYRPEVNGGEITLGLPQKMSIGVSCAPLRDDVTNNYKVKVTFTAGEVNPSDATLLSTDIDDMGIRLSKKLDSDAWIKYGEGQVMPQNTLVSGDRSHFSQDFYWFLRYLPNKQHGQNGIFSAIATYTVTVE